MILAKSLSSFLKEKGISEIYVKKLKKKPFLQRLAVDILLHNLKIAKRENYGKEICDNFGIKLYSGRGNSKINYEISSEGETIQFDYPKFPVFIIDLSLWNRHSDEDKNKLLIQLECSLNTIRNYLWDYNLVFNNPPENTPLLHIDNMVRYNIKPSRDTIVLNPYGDVEANEEIIRNSKYFIIGGIIDRSGWKNATNELSRIANYDEFPQVKITLRGSTVGVPDRINKIIEIVLRTIYGENLESAILETQSNADKFSRLLMEANRGNLDEAIEFLKPNEKVLNRLRSVKGIKL
ncbi:tRNA (guanine-N1)-methyltransferase [Acidianus sulfidivorans JP7]|uniref:tRNA (Guanine-N1)-methyltransferase n=1 Tax=Acidianus sulfidivorans JP7 TaxID=619593 RepID=A0A2U9IMZ9_9CREN|nr:tRNA (adenine(9)-N1)-methyltransferase Trm10 [Acidianus sulfidivorans]AWR97403.1 tRNA (guanine-N1)-methyltransferase [Acidianus sulfidivorans JP7]